MANKPNDPVVGVCDMADLAVRADQKAAEAIGPVMNAILQLLGDAERLHGPVVPMLQWAEELNGPKMKAITERILTLSDCDKVAIKEAVKNAPNASKGAELRASLEGRARKITKAIQLIGANALLASKHEAAENGRTSFFSEKNLFRIPLQWFVPDEYVYAGLPTASVTFMYGNATPMKLTAYKVSDMGTDNEGSIYDLPYRPNMEGFIDLAYNRVKEKRGARPDGNEKSSDDASSNDSSSNGSTGATGGQQQERKRATPSEARDICALEAGRDDYKHRPTGEVATEWQSMFDHMALNPFYRAMMIKAIAKANKTEGEAAASQNAA